MICRGRSLLLSRAYLEGYERILFWDDDLVPANPEAVLRMLRWKPEDFPEHRLAPVVGGVYAQKGEPRICADGVGRFRAEGEPTTVTLGKPGYVRCSYVATGSMVIDRQTLKAIVESTPRYPIVHECTHEVSGETFWDFFRPSLRALPAGPGEKTRYQYLGEDYSFCDRAAQAGVAVYLATEPLLGHVGSFTWFVQDSLQAQGGRLSPLASQVNLEDA